MLHVFPMPLALVTAASAGDCAGLDERLCRLKVDCEVAQEHSGGHLAHVRAIEVKANALRDLGNRALAEAGVGAGGTRMPADGAGLDAAAECFRVEVRLVPSCLENLLRVLH